MSKCRKFHSILRSSRSLQILASLSSFLSFFFPLLYIFVISNFLCAPHPTFPLALQKRHVSIWSVSTNFPRNCVACNWSALFAEKINSFSTATHSPKKSPAVTTFYDSISELGSILHVWEHSGQAAGAILNFSFFYSIPCSRVGHVQRWGKNGEEKGNPT